jgi:hypothetical protein
MVTLRVEREERDRLKRAAWESGRSLQAWAEEILLGAAESAEEQAAARALACGCVGCPEPDAMRRAA